MNEFGGLMKLYILIPLAHTSDSINSYPQMYQDMFTEAVEWGSCLEFTIELDGCPNGGYLHRPCFFF